MGICKTRIWTLTDLGPSFKALTLVAQKPNPLLSRGRISFLFVCNLLLFVKKNNQPKSNMADEFDFASADAGASSTYPMQCSALRKSGFVMIKGRPCKIVEMSTSKTGKHGHAKVHMVAPNVSRKDYQLIDVDDGYLSLMDDTGATRDDLKVPEGDVGDECNNATAEGRDIMCTVLSACGEEAVIATKVNTAVDK